MNKRAIIVFAVCILIVFILVTLASANANAKQVIVRFKGEEKPSISELNEIGTVKHEFKYINAFLIDIPEGKMKSLEKSEKIAYLEPVIKIRTLEQTTPWGISRIDAPAVHPYNRGTGIRVCVIDTGIDYNHTDLKDNYKGGYDFHNDDADPIDDNGHGTHCAGTIAAEDNDKGVIGVAPEAHIYALKAIGANGTGEDVNAIKAIEWAIENNIQVISMSWSLDNESQACHDVCDAAYNHGIVLVAAAGNSGDEHPDDDVVFPARYDSVIAVAATDINDNRASWSSDGPEVELAAPGVNIYSTYKNGGYASGDGTSMSCPHVAGTTALILKTKPGSYDANGNTEWDSIEIKRKLRGTADDLGAVGKDNYFGYGLVNASKAATFSSPPPPPVPVPEFSPIGLLAFIGILSVVLAVATLRKRE